MAAMIVSNIADKTMPGPERRRDETAAEIGDSVISTSSYMRSGERTVRVKIQKPEEQKNDDCKAVCRRCYILIIKPGKLVVHKMLEGVHRLGGISAADEIRFLEDFERVNPRKNEYQKCRGSEQRQRNLSRLGERDRLPSRRA